MGTYPTESAAGEWVAGLSAASWIDGALSVFFLVTAPFFLIDSTGGLLGSLFGFGSILYPLTNEIDIFAESSHGVTAGYGKAGHQGDGQADEGD
jgi:hypothetical protein